MGADVKKQYLCLDKIPILARTITAFDRCDFINEIVLVVPAEDLTYCRETIIDPYSFVKKIHMVEGGQQRQDSVYNGLKTVADKVISPNESIVLIHDGVRPFVSPGMIENCIETAVKHGACLPVISVSDTLKRVDKDGHVSATIERRYLYCAQTPQTFRLSVIQAAFEYAERSGFTGTDDASLAEHSGHPVVICEGSKFNIKLTTPEDLALGEFFLGMDI